MDKKDTYGNTSFIVEFESGDKGFYTSKNEDQKNFVVGTESEYVIEEKQGAKAKYFKITVPQTQQQQKWSGGGGKPQQDPKTSMISFSASYTKDLIVAGKVGLDKFGDTFDIIYNKMISKL